MDLLENWDLKGDLDHEVNQDHPETKAHKVHPDNQVHQVSREDLEQEVNLDLRDQLETQELKAHLENLVLLDQPVTPELADRQELRDPQVLREKEAYLDLLEVREDLVHKDHLDLKDRQ